MEKYGGLVTETELRAHLNLVNAQTNGGLQTIPETDLAELLKIIAPEGTKPSENRYGGIPKQGRLPI